MKILYHHRIRSKDGQYVHLSAIVDALRRRRHEVVLVGPKIIETGAFGGDGGFVARLKATIPPWFYEIMESAYGVIALMRLLWAVFKHRPDAIYERYTLFLPWAGLVRRLTGSPYLLEINAPLSAERLQHDGLVLEKLARWTERTAWRGASITLPVTQVLAGYVRDAGVPSEQIEVIGNGVVLDDYNVGMPSGAARSAWGFDERVILGFTGFVREWHGLDRIIAIMAKHPDLALHLVIAGEGPAVPSLKDQATSHGIASSVSFAGLVERKDIPGLVSCFDIALQPAVVAYASPLKLFEYMAMGRAIIAPDQPNIREYLEDGIEGWLCDPTDDLALEKALLTLSHDTHRRQTMGHAARLRLEKQRLTWDDNAARIEAIIQRLQNTASMHQIDIAERG